MPLFRGEKLNFKPKIESEISDLRWRLERNDHAVCPHCGHENEDVEFRYGCREEGDNLVTEIECDSCQKEFVVSLCRYNQSEGYTIYPIKCKDDKHSWVKGTVTTTDDGFRYQHSTCKKCWERDHYMIDEKGKKVSEEKESLLYHLKTKEAQPIQDTKTGVLHADGDRVVINTSEPEGNNVVFDRVLARLKQIGFEIGVTEDIKKYYPTLSHTHKGGIWNGLEFEANFYPAGMEFKFFQNVFPGDRDKGQGKYENDKFKNADYLMRTRLNYVKREITKLLNSMNDCKFTSAVKEEKDWHGHAVVDDSLSIEENLRRLRAYPVKENYHNASPQKDGDLVYYYDYSGNLSRGILFKRNDSCSYVVQNHKIEIAMTREIYSTPSGLTPRKKKDRHLRLRKELQNAIESLNLKRAGTLHRILESEGVKVSVKTEISEIKNKK